MIPFSDATTHYHSKPAVTITFIVINSVVFALQILFGGISTIFGDAGIEAFQIFHKWGFIPSEFSTGQSETYRNVTGYIISRGQVVPLTTPIDIDTPVSDWATLLSSMFMHSSGLHFAGNMLYLWVFGDNVEHRLGPLRFAVFYLTCGIAATFCHWFFFQSSGVPLIGASGAISGVLGAYFLLYPYNRVKVLFMFVFITVLELQAMYVLSFYLLLQFYQLLGSLGVSNQTSVALWAHIGGFTIGVLLIAVYKKMCREPIWPRKYNLITPRKRGLF